MRNKAHILPFPQAGKKDEGPRRNKRPPRTTDSIKYFSRNQIKLLRRTAREQAELDTQKNKITGIREWMAIDLLTSTGLRVSEAANLKCGDLKIGYSESKVFIHNGKGSISGHIIIHEALKKHLKQFLAFKQANGEGIADDDFLFIGQRGKWTSQAIQQLIKKYLRKLTPMKKGNRPTPFGTAMEWSFIARKRTCGPSRSS